MIYILGGGGFVGSAITRYCLARGLEHRVITRLNYDEHCGTGCDVLVDASGNSKKYLADRDPLADFDQSVRLKARALHAFEARHYVLISTGDVYNDPSCPATSDETVAIDIARLSRYGQHKFLAEQLVIARHPNWLIVRAGGFVGSGLRKNAIFDMLTGARLRLSPASALQFLHTDDAAEIVMGLALAGVSGEIVNLGGRGTVRLDDLRCELGAQTPFDAAAPTVRYELSLGKLAALAPHPIPNSWETVVRFAADWATRAAS